MIYKVLIFVALIMFVAWLIGGVLRVRTKRRF
jgi:hypothetical protein